MTHVLMADAFAGKELPRWADEGMAMQADLPDKLARHSRDLNEAIQRRQDFHVGELLTEPNYPTGNGRAVFYGESASLVGFLTSRRPAADFVAFVRRADDEGYDAALHEMYGIKDVGQLEDLWKSHAEVAMRRVRWADPDSHRNATSFAWRFYSDRFQRDSSSELSQHLVATADAIAAFRLRLLISGCLIIRFSSGRWQQRAYPSSNILNLNSVFIANIPI